MITDVDGVRVGHWTAKRARTGCTVVLLPEGTVASGEVRGGAPATREFALLAPERLVSHIDAVVLSGGSAFGLAAADGVMLWCEERGHGFATAAGPVPIVVGMSLYDLTVGRATVRPGPEEGSRAARAARGGRFAVGQVGAGTGATVGKWRGRDAARPGGIGSASVRRGHLVVGALVAVNAYGDIDGPDRPGWPEWPDWPDLPAPAAPDVFASTTIGVIATNARLDKGGCLLMAQSGHDGLARALVPAHARVDGDALVAAATGGVDIEPGELDVLRHLAVRAVEEAVRSVG